MIGLTEQAAIQMRKLLNEKKDVTGIRVGVEGGGCSGFRYKLEFEKEPKDNDRIVEKHGVVLYIDPKSYLYLMGTTINYIDTLNGAGFKFENPAAKRMCGCGESFSI